MPRSSITQLLPARPAPRAQQTISFQNKDLDSESLQTRIEQLFQRIMSLPVRTRIAGHFLVQIAGILAREFIVKKGLLASQIRNERVSANGGVHGIGAKTEGRILTDCSAS